MRDVDSDLLCVGVGVCLFVVQPGAVPDLRLEEPRLHHGRRDDALAVRPIWPRGDGAKAEGAVRRGHAGDGHRRRRDHVRRVRGVGRSRADGEVSGDEPGSEGEGHSEALRVDEWLDGQRLEESVEV